MKPFFAMLKLAFLIEVWAHCPLANSQSLLPCLGKEEQSLHKSRETGPEYLINRKLIEEVAALSELKLKYNFYDLICSSKSHRGVSIKLLNALIQSKEDIFEIPQISRDPEKEVQRNLTQDFVNSSPILALEFMELVQASAGTPDCIEKQFPGYRKIVSRLKSLQEYLPPESLEQEIRNEIIKMKFFDRYEKKVKKCQPKPPTKSTKS